MEWLGCCYSWSDWWRWNFKKSGITQQWWLQVKWQRPIFSVAGNTGGNLNLQMTKYYQIRLVSHEITTTLYKQTVVREPHSQIEFPAQLFSHYMNTWFTLTILLTVPELVDTLPWVQGTLPLIGRWVGWTYHSHINFKLKHWVYTACYCNYLSQDTSLRGK